MNLYLLLDGRHIFSFLPQPGINGGCKSLRLGKNEGSWSLEFRWRLEPGFKIRLGHCIGKESIDNDGSSRRHWKRRGGVLVGGRTPGTKQKETKARLIHCHSFTALYFITSVFRLHIFLDLSLFFLSTRFVNLQLIFTPESHELRPQLNVSQTPHLASLLRNKMIKVRLISISITNHTLVK